MQKGQAATVTRGPYRGQELSVDHIIPRAVGPELDNVIANLELMPLGVNEGKNAKVGPRQLDLGRKLHKAGLLGPEGLRKLEERRTLHPGARGRRSEASFPRPPLTA